LKYHKLANLFPLIQGDEFDGLKNDILNNGLNHPIIMYQGKILDGRNRYRACTESGVEPIYENYTGDKPLEYVISLNLFRRHLNETQRAMIGASITTLNHGGNRKNQDANLRDEITIEQASEKLNISKRSIDTARKVRKNAIPKLIEIVEQGLITISFASSLSELSKIEQKSIVKKILSGVKPEQARRENTKENLINMVIPKGKYRVIYADPPWQYDNPKAVEIGKVKNLGAGHHYPTMPVDEICKLDIQSITNKDAVLFLWATFPKLVEATQVLEAWGFTYKTSFVWNKLRSNLGSYHNACAELLMIGTKGNCSPDNNSMPSQVQEIKSGKHSVKPDEIRELIDKMYPYGTRIELFSRDKGTKGWKVWGNEIKAV